MELLDVYDDFGKKTGRVIVRGDKNEKLGEHEHIAVAVIYIENNKGEFLMQKTSIEKGGEFSSTGGHVCHDEEPLESIQREVFEELGVSVDKDEIKYLGYLLYDKPIRHMFYLKKDIDINDVIVQKEEVEFAKYLTIDEINTLIEKEEITKSHGIIFREIIKYIGK